MGAFDISLLSLLFLIALSIVWGTLKTGISPMMSSTKACQVMLNLSERAESGTVIDLGSGWGTLVIAAARKYPERQVIGYELSWFPWLFSMLRKHFLGLDNLTIYRDNFKHQDLNHTAVLFCYLFPAAMIALNEKLERELLGKTVIVSNTFALPSCSPVEVIKLQDLYQTPIYLYVWQPE